MYKILWDDDAKTDFLSWLKNDKLVAKRIELLIHNIQDTPEFGIGKPEKLKHQLSGYLSRRITLEHRLIYKVLTDKKQVWIVSCRGHYD